MMMNSSSLDSQKPYPFANYLKHSIAAQQSSYQIGWKKNCFSLAAPNECKNIQLKAVVAWIVFWIALAENVPAFAIMIEQD